MSYIIEFLEIKIFKKIKNLKRDARINPIRQIEASGELKRIPIRSNH